jgi:hypothetical protein
VAGRVIFAALVMLVGEDRLFTLPDGQRLPDILEKSRKYQNLVSTKLAEQVLAALYELLRGFQAADDQRKGKLLRQVLQDEPNQVYAGLLTVLLRLVFLLYAEDRGLISDPQDELYQNFYAITGLFERLRADAGRYTDTMDHRFGAWAQLLALFRLIHDGGRHGRFAIPARKGYLFDPDKYPFLEGRAPGQPSYALPPDEADTPGPTLPTPYSQLPTPQFRTRRVRITVDPPHISDGVIFRVLQNLLILDGERLSYRTLDVEQIGSVYETMMGFDLEVAQGRSIAIKPAKPHGAPTAINLEELLAAKPADRAKWLKEKSDQAVTGQAAAALKDARTAEDLVAALEKKVARAATPNIVPPGAMVLQPSDERRRSGSHYTPRSLTEPIVETTFRPIFERLSSPLPSRERVAAQQPGEGVPGQTPTPDQILDLKVCDPAMGSGAFLVAAARFLSAKLVKAWHDHSAVPRIPLDEDELLHAARIVAQRCLYGVDKNPMAVDLAKLSLWLATLAKNHPFTFLDHALKCGDSLVGLTKAQILGFHWKPEKQRDFARAAIEGQLSRALDQRRQIREAPEGTPEGLQHERLTAADGFLDPGRRYGDLVISAFFAGDNDRKRKERLEALSESLAAQRGQFDVSRHERLYAAVRELRGGPHPLVPFHWQIEFPEVFDRENLGFDAFVGNPPFAGKNTLLAGHREGYLDWLKTIHEKSHGNADLVAHFFRRAFNQIRVGGAFGLIATNTIGQGDTRATGLRWICKHSGTIFAATRRKKWPGQAAVIVSIVHVHKGDIVGPYILDGREVPIVTAYLFHAGGHDDPDTLKANSNKSFIGSYVLGMGFTFDDTDKNGLANPVSLMHRLIEKDQRNAERIFPYIGGEEVNDEPTHAPSRYVINFGDAEEEDARRWPDLMRIVEEKVRPQRESQNDRYGRENWWKFLRTRPEMQEATARLARVLLCSRIGNAFAFTFMPKGIVLNEKIVVFAFAGHNAFASMQSRVHEVWTRFFSSTLKDDLQYTPSDCFETFPFPEDFETAATLESAGQAYYEFRATLMVRNNEGLTKTYNRFHDPDERSPDILKLRELHAALDRAVLDAYGWTELKPTCKFLLDYEEDEDEEDGSGGSGVGSRRRKKPWRYRWPDEFRDEVLARLLELNRQRAEEERLSGAADSGRNKASKKSTGSRKAGRKNPDQREFFESR